MEDSKQINILRIGIANLSELEEIVKAFRLMNQYSKRRRYIVSREDLKDAYGNIIVEKAHDINISVVKLLQRNFKPDTNFKIFSHPKNGKFFSSAPLAPGVILFTKATKMYIF